MSPLSALTALALAWPLPASAAGRASVAPVEARVEVSGAQQAPTALALPSPPDARLFLSLSQGPLAPMPESVALPVAAAQPPAAAPMAAQAALGTPGVYSDDFHLSRTNERIRRDVEAGRFVRLQVADGELAVTESGTALKPGTLKRVGARARALGRALSSFNGASVLLVEPADGSPEAGHPRLLVVTDKDYQVAHAGRRAAYLTAGLFADEAVDPALLTEVLAEELGHSRERSEAGRLGRAPPREAFGDRQLSALERLRPAVAADFAAGRPVDPEPARVESDWWIVRALSRAWAWVRTPREEPKVPWSFKTPDGDFYYHGTTMEDLIRIVDSGGVMTPVVSQFSLHVRDSLEYGGRRQGEHAAAGRPTPLVLLQFSEPALRGYMSGKMFQPAIDAALMMGVQPMHAAYVAAEKPVPLAMMTAESKDSILRWLILQRAAHPEDPRWDALLPRFEAALGKRWTPMSDQLALGTPGVYTKAFHRDRANPRIREAMEAGRFVRLKVAGGALVLAEEGPAVGAGVAARALARAAALPRLPAAAEGAEVVLLDFGGSRLLVVTEEDYQVAHAGTRRDERGRPTGRFAYLTSGLFADPLVSDAALAALLEEELGHASARAAGEAAPEAFGDAQLAALLRLLPALSADFAAGRPLTPEPPLWSPANPALRFFVWAWRAFAGWLSSLRGIYPEFVSPDFPTPTGYYYTGTSLDDLKKIVRGDAAKGYAPGRMAAVITYLSDEAGYAYNYAGTRTLMTRSPGFVLQFEPGLVKPHLVRGHYQPWETMGDMKYGPLNPKSYQPTFFMAETPFPLSAMTEASKKTILRWLTLQMAAHPEDTAWPALVAEFEAALGYRYDPAPAGI